MPAIRRPSTIRGRRAAAAPTPAEQCFREAPAPPPASTLCWEGLEFTRERPGAGGPRRCVAVFSGADHGWCCGATPLAYQDALRIEVARSEPLSPEPPVPAEAKHLPEIERLMVRYRELRASGGAYGPWEQQINRVYKQAARENDVLTVKTLGDDERRLPVLASDGVLQAAADAGCWSAAIELIESALWDPLDILDEVPPNVLMSRRFLPKLLGQLAWGDYFGLVASRMILQGEHPTGDADRNVLFRVLLRQWVAEQGMAPVFRGALGLE